MNFKKTTLTIIALIVIVTCLTVVSAGFFDFTSDDNGNTLGDDITVEEPSITDQDTLIKSSIKLKYTKPVKSSKYGYYYENGGFAEDAYWAPWSCKATFKLDVEKIFENEFGPNSNYTLDDFKKDLKYMVKHDYIDFDLLINNGGSLFINETAITSSLNKDCSVLTIKCDYLNEEYHTKTVKETISKIKHADDVDITISLSKYGKRDYLTGDENMDIHLEKLPVKVSKMG